jgi:hypothetical protein
MAVLNVNGAEIEIPVSANQERSFHLFLDASVAELIVDRRHAITTRIYRVPAGPLDLTFYDRDAAITTPIKIWQMNAISRDRLST